MDKSPDSKNAMSIGGSLPKYCDPNSEISFLYSDDKNYQCGSPESGMDKPPPAPKLPTIDLPAEDDTGGAQTTITIRSGVGEHIGGNLLMRRF